MATKSAREFMRRALRDRVSGSVKEKMRLNPRISKVTGGIQTLPAEGLGTRVAKKVGPYAPGLLLFAAIQKMLNLPTEMGEADLQREALQSQGRSVTPESLYYQAALPQAQLEESEARQSLMSHLSGGVIGPSLARGERLIGGR